MARVWSPAKGPVMPIININKVNNRLFNMRKNIFCFALMFFLTGCGSQGDFNQPKDNARQSQIYYERAVKEYKGLIAQGKDLDRLYFSLGQLYYSHGDFAAAIEALKKTPDIKAKKLLAISYYKSGDFTTALENLANEELKDDEYLYYRGLTCEKLNLFDQALDAYKKIKGKEFAPLALKRIDVVAKEAHPGNIKDISPEISKILANAPSGTEYPQAGGLVLFCDEKIEITPEDSQVSYLHYVVKILNERGKEKFAETGIDYDSTYEKVELEYARTIKPDGTVTDVGSRHIRDVSKYLNFPLYSNARVYIISFPEITEGAIIEYKVKIYRNQLINKKDFVLDYPLQASEPIITANFNLSIPETKALYIKTLNEEYNDFGAQLKPRVEKRSGSLIYSWQFKNIPQIIPESNMPADVEINPAMIISTFSSWQEIYQWWWKLAGEKIKADAAIKNKVKELTRGLDSKDAQLKAIYNFCAQEIRYVAVEYGQAGYEPHKAEDVFKNKYGDCKDQAILLVTMLKDAGFKACPVLIPTRDCYNLNENFPSMLFNHCIAAVMLEDGLVFLDATAETCSFGDLPSGDQNRNVLVIKEDGYKIQGTPLYPATHNRLEQRLKIRINNDDTITAEKENFTYGVYDQAQRHWLLYAPPELIRDKLQETIQDISIGAKLGPYDIKNLDNLNLPVVLSYSFQGQDFLTSAGSLKITPQLASLDTSLVAKDKRKYAIEFGFLDTKEKIFEIEIPEHFVVKYIPQGINEDSLWLKFMAEYTQEKNKIIFRQRLELKRETVAQAEYQDFKNFFEILAKKTKERVVLEKTR